MITPKVSIIIPVYKVEKYIERCLHYLFNQSLKELEFIFVDDCSPDSSINIITAVLEEYPHRKSQVKIIRHKTNQGVSQSRQDGVDVAMGEYIIHCDPDDWMELSMYENLYIEAKKTNTDIVISDYYASNNGTDSLCNQKPSGLNSESLLKDIFINIHGSCWNKLVKREFIYQSKVRFDTNISFCEDLLYFTQLLLHNPSISYVNNAYYHYQINCNPNSLVRTYSDKQYANDLYLSNKLLKLTSKSYAYKYCKSHLAYLLTWRAFIGSNMSSSQYRSKFYSQSMQLIKSNAPLLSKLLLIMSCLGMYKLAHTIYITYKRII